MNISNLSISTTIQVVIAISSGVITFFDDITSVFRFIAAVVLLVTAIFMCCRQYMLYKQQKAIYDAERAEKERNTKIVTDFR